MNNSNFEVSRSRLIRGQTYKDLSTVCIIPTRGMIHARVIQSWFNLMTPMNQKFYRFFMWGMEVGDAYNKAVESILGNPELSKWKYVFTLEDDVIPPPDALLKLYEAIEGGVDGKRYDVVGALYWTKFENSQPMIYGNPKEIPLSFRPQLPIPDTIQPACGLGMGCNLFRLSIFKDKDLPKPWFKTLQEYTPGVGTRGFTQDLYFFQNAGLKGYRFGCDTRVKAGHFDVASESIW